MCDRNFSSEVLPNPQLFLLFLGLLVAITILLKVPSFLAEVTGLATEAVVPHGIDSIEAGYLSVHVVDGVHGAPSSLVSQG